MDLKSIQSRMPEDPGVYLFKDRSGRVIYVGKAKNLKKRVLSYFRPQSDFSQKTAVMMDKAEKLDYILTSTENEALILESSLIKKYMPRYNVVLRDDKQYPCLRLGIKEDFPRLSIVRKIKKDGAVYFGPFSSSHSVRNTLKLIDKIFQLRKCRTIRLPKRSRPCLHFQLGRCLGPCTQEVSVDSYRDIVNQVRLFLEGRNRELLKKMKRDMAHFAEKQYFEDAARIRDRIRDVEKTIERQDVVSTRMEDQDVIGLAREGEAVQLVILFVRRGYLLGSRDYHFKEMGSPDSEIIEAFLKQFYRQGTSIPKKILLSKPIDDLLPITNWISELAGKRVSIIHPLKGEKRRIVRIAISNAENLLSLKEKGRKGDLVEGTKSALKLKKVPKYIEGLDISNLYGKMAVGAIVSFVDGLPNGQGYRNFKIRDVEGIDDYGMISELVRRRLSKGNLPDLFVVDGGKGHLSAVKRVLEKIPDDEKPELVSIAKADEKAGETTDKIYLPDRKNPLSLRGDHPVLFLLMRIRDEAHRRAITYHRKLRHRNLKESRIDLIPGIGFQRKKVLLQYFGNMDAVSRATADDLAHVPGISDSLAKRISNFFSQEE